jgi:gluconate 2-dehydrogenase gamma chain
MANETIPRRDFLKGAGVAGVSVAAAATGISACSPETKVAGAASEAAPESWQVLTQQEVAFFTAAADTIIPKDELSPSGSECGIPVFIDRQLASAWGGGDRMYRAGPFVKGTPEQGYQLPLTPNQFFVAGVQAANAWCEKTYGKSFDRLEQAKREEALTAMQKGTAEFDGLDSKQFFTALVTINMEGFFSDPIYGGNRNKASWRMIGFPGLPAVYADKVDEYRDKRFVVAEPQSIADFS